MSIIGHREDSIVILVQIFWFSLLPSSGQNGLPRALFSSSDFKGWSLNAAEVLGKEVIPLKVQLRVKYKGEYRRSFKRCNLWSTPDVRVQIFINEGEKGLERSLALGK